jgi:hypothetical protein
MRVWRPAGHMKSGVIANCLYNSVTVSLFLSTYPVPTSSNNFLKHFEKRYTKKVCDILCMLPMLVCAELMVNKMAQTTFSLTT